MSNPYKLDFPIYNSISTPSLTYLDSAATSHKPKFVIDAISKYYMEENANPHRGLYGLSIKATNAYENSREKVAKFINAKSSREVIFTRNATEAINLVAYSYGRMVIEEGDEIVVSILEHHSNLLPWQQLAKEKKAVLKYLYLNKDYRISKEEINDKITSKTKIVAINHVSNVLGTTTPLKEIVNKAHENNAIVLLDAAQSIPHYKIDVIDLNIDFLVFSGHKMLAPMGIGVLYGREKLLENMPPFLSGGDMIEYVSEQTATFAPLPQKFEAGTPNVSGAVGLAAAIDYIEHIGYENINKIENQLVTYALSEMSKIPYIEVYGNPENKRCGLISFNVKDIHPHDTASILDSHGIAIRAGHHCAQPLMKFLGVHATCRASFYIYNTKDDVDQFIEGLKNIRRWLGYGD